MQRGIWREIKRGERMVLYYTVCVCVCVLIVQADFLKSIFFSKFLLSCCPSVFSSCLSQSAEVEGVCLPSQTGQDKLY